MKVSLISASLIFMSGSLENPSDVSVRCILLTPPVATSVRFPVSNTSCYVHLSPTYSMTYFLDFYFGGN